MTTNWIEQFNKDFRDCYNGKNSIGIEYYDLPKKKLFDFITTLLEKQREEYVEMIEKYKPDRTSINYIHAVDRACDDIINLIKNK